MQSMNDTFTPERFIDAQNDVYDTVIKELKSGRKKTHWMWYIFPQLSGLGGSERSRRYAMLSLDDAKAYLEHPVLGARLKECTHLVVDIPETRIEKIFDYPDNLKFWSCATLFGLVAGEGETLFQAALEKFFDGKPDPLTVEMLGL